MSKIKLLNQLLVQYKKWTLRLKNSNKDIENNILQKDSADKLQEKFVSVGISMVIVYIVTGVLGLFGFAVAGVWVVIFFAIGWMLSKFVNKRIFGVEREFEDLSESEKILLKKLESIHSKHVSIRDSINNKSMVVNFTNYSQLNRELNEVLKMLFLYDKSKLALKYKYNHSVVTKKYKVAVNTFDEIYANKRKGV